jgi:hypothetical protein
MLRIQKSLTTQLKPKQSQLLNNLEDVVLNEVHIIHTRFECKIPTCANRPTGFSPCCVPGDIICNPIYGSYCHEPNNGNLLSEFVEYEFERITQNGR